MQLNAGIRHHQIKPPKVGNRLCHRRGHLLTLADISRNGEGRMTGSRQFRCHRLYAYRRQPDTRHLRTLTAHQPRRGRADTTTGARDQDDFFA